MKIKLILIERKTINDLASSIRDGRHREQKKRLMCSGLPIHKCMYLLEGDVNKVYSNRIDTRTIIGSIINTIIRDNIKVYRTDNLIDTKILLDRIYDKLLKEPHKLFESNIEYEATVKIAKKDNMTPEICNVIQLAQIPGISTKIARSNLLNVGFNDISIDQAEYSTSLKCLLNDVMPTVYKYVSPNNKKWLEIRFRTTFPF